MLKAARDRVYQRIVARQLMERVNGVSESASELRTKSAVGSKKCNTSVDRLETHEPVAPLVKHSLAMMQVPLCERLQHRFRAQFRTPVTPLQHHSDGRLQ